MAFIKSSLRLEAMLLKVFLLVLTVSGAWGLGGGGDPIRASSCSRLHMGGGPIRANSLPRLIDLVRPTQRGAETTTEAKEEIIALIDSIEEQQASFVQRDAKFLDKCNGVWELLWTTEKETLFFQKSGLFGASVTNIVQEIDTKNNKLTNLIAFDGGREFRVEGSVAPDPAISNQLNFKFQSATLLIPPFINLRIPPVGSGWFRNVYANQEYRLSRDVRGDYLVSRRID